MPEPGAPPCRPRLPRFLPRARRPSSHQPAASTSPTSLHQQHQQQLAYLQQQQSPTRSAFLQHQHRELSSEQQARCGPGGHPLGAKAVPGAASNRTSPGSAAAAAAAAVVGTGGQARRGAEAEAAPRPQPGSRRGSSAGNTDSYSFSAQPAGPAPAHPVAPPSSYAPSDGAPSSRQSPHSARTASGTAPPAAAAPPPAAAAGGSRPTGSRPNGSRTFLLSKLNRAQGRYGDSAGSARFGAYTRVRCGCFWEGLAAAGVLRACPARHQAAAAAACLAASPAAPSFPRSSPSSWCPLPHHTLPSSPAPSFPAWHAPAPERKNKERTNKGRKNCPCPSPQR